MGSRGPKGSATLSNSEFVTAVEDRSEGVGVSSASKRGTTQTEVKAAKYRLSVEGSCGPKTVRR